MKRLLLITLLGLLAYGAYAQEYSFVRERVYLEGDYNRTEGFTPSIALAFDGRLNSGNGLNMGYLVGPGKHCFNLAYQIGVDGPGVWDYAYIENRYLYRRFTGYGLQEFNAMLTLGYRNLHWNFQLGLCNRYIAEIPLRKNGGESIIFEPMNVVFNIQGNLFPEHPAYNYHRWNIGGGISNYREFIIERVTLFYYTIHGYYDITEESRLIGEAGLHPAGVLNLSSQYNGYFINIGCIYQKQ